MIVRCGKGLVVGACLLLVACQSQAAIQPDFLMDQDPVIPAVEPIKKFSPELKKLWLQALDRPEVDMQRMAAETIARAHLFGVPELEETIPSLERLVLAESTHAAVRYAAARALVVMNARDSDEKLLKASQDYGGEIRQLIEPALASWNVTSLNDVWKQRLETRSTRHRELILAIRGVARTRDASALPLLMALVQDLVRSSDIRLEAALAAGKMVDDGLEAEATRLASETRSPAVFNRLCAVRLLEQHRSETAVQLLAELAAGDEPLVAGAALKRLNDIDSSLVIPLAENLFKNGDARVREEAALSYVTQPTVERVGVLVSLLNDPHPDLRQLIAENLAKLAEQSELDDAIRAGATDVLSSDDWRGQEQAVLLLATLDHKPAASRMAELLDSPRTEVMIAAAWGLRKLQVAETIPAIAAKVIQQSQDRLTKSIPGVDDQVAHLFEALGVMNFKEAEPLLLKYVPYAGRLTPLVERSRGAAVWTLGRLHAGQPSEGLVGQLVGRLNDNSSAPPESTLVKIQCVIALVQMNAVDEVGSIKKDLDKGSFLSRLALARQWAIKQLTGDELPELTPQVGDSGSWFLEPLRDSGSH